MNQQDYHIEELLPLYIEGKLSPEEKNIVEDWLEESEAHQQLFEDEKQLYRDTESWAVLESLDEEEALAKVKRRFKQAKMKHLFLKLQRAAAVLFIPLLLGTIILAIKIKNEGTVNMLSIQTNPGMTATTTLPDGTVVILNSNSTLSYPSKFVGNTRNVSLKGEAYFSVTKDKEHPFLVGTSSTASVKVYGTKFNVDAYPESQIIRATLEEGSIGMQYIDKFQRECEKIIKPGEAIAYSTVSKDVQVTNTDVDAIISWKDNKLIFRNTSMKEVLNMLSKRFDIQFIVKNKNVYDIAFTGTLERQRLDKVLEFINLSSGIKFKYKTDKTGKDECQTIEVY